MATDEKPSSQDALPIQTPPVKDSIIGTCHCGRTEVEVPSKPTKINECRCSICYKYGALWGYYNRGDVTVTSAAGTRLNRYVRSDDQGAGDGAFVRCGHCGCVTNWWGQGSHAGDEKIMGVNCRLLPPSALEGVERIQTGME